jgi:hypothetical protein
MRMSRPFLGLKTRVTPIVGFAGLCFASSLGFGCSKSEEVKPDAKPIVGVLELPISHRHGASEPSDAARIEIGTGEIRLAGETVIALENGKVPAAELSGNMIPKLKAKLAGKRALALTVYAASPYATLLRVIESGFEAGARELAFRVRKPGSTSETGWLTLHESHVAPSADDSKFDQAALLPWEKFANVWEESLDACQAGMRGGDCGYRPIAKAVGGKLDLMLRVRGPGLALRFRQTGAPPPPEAPKKPKAELMEGLKGAKAANAAAAAEEAPPEPATEHVFTLRAEQAAELPSSPVSAIVKPVCGSISCPAVLESEGISMSSTVISLIGAAFPDGTPEPKLAWVLPKK